MKKNLKSFLCVALAAVFMLCLLTSCADGSSQQKSGTNNTENQQPANNNQESNNTEKSPEENNASAESNASGNTENAENQVEEAVETNVSDTAESDALLSFEGGYTTFDCYADGTYKFEYPGMVEEHGTWSWKDWTFTVTTEGGNEIVAVMDDETHALNFKYVADINEMLQDDFTCAAAVWSQVLDAQTGSYAPIAAALLSFEGGYTTFDCYADGTYKFEYPGMVEEHGTWSWKDWTFTVTTEGGNEIVAVMDDETHALNFKYVADINEMLQDDFTCAAAVWSQVLDAQTGSYDQAA